jgi:hypothetical protein
MTRGKADINSFKGSFNIWKWQNAKRKLPTNLYLLRQWTTHRLKTNGLELHSNWLTASEETKVL